MHLTHAFINVLVTITSGDSGADLPLALMNSGTAFLPIQTFSDRADELIKAFEERLKNDTTLPVGLREQYGIQLGMLKDPNVPDNEIVLFPFTMTPDGESL